MYFKTTPQSFAFALFALVVVLVFLNLIFMISRENEMIVSNHNARKFHAFPVAQNYERKDWHDWQFIEYEKTRTGPGEHGKGLLLTDPYEIELNKNLSKVEGLSPLATDKISVNRSVPDGRLPVCKTIKYLTKLPMTSVVIIFYNELTSLLLRTVHSVYNRTPHELLHEIILINDCSTKQELFEPLQTYIRNNFDGRVRVVNLKERKGLIVARMEGARRATGEVLVFFDAHMEVHANWLPPLLEPIAIDPLTSTLPIIDDTDPDDFSITSMGNGDRGIFDWELTYRWVPRRPEDQVHPEQPAPYPVMLGCAFAIRKDYFFSLGGYDEQLQIWNGENYELSFKLWLCGGKLLEVPCSRVSHLFRYKNKNRSSPNYDYVAHNFKRLAEVWFGDFKHCLYSNDPGKYEKIDAGDLTRAKQIRKSLNCKPFQYFLEHIMPDQMFRYPCNPGVFASGFIQSEAYPDLCVDTLHTDIEVGLYECSKNRTRPGKHQHFELSWHRQIIKVPKHFNHCLDTHKTRFYECHFGLGTQFWFYNTTSQQIMNSPEKCLRAIIDSESLELVACSDKDPDQRWIWSYTNKTALQNWSTFGVKLPKCPEGEKASFQCTT